MPRPLPSRLFSGFTLLEVLIAVVVLAIGVLGLALLQFSALRGDNQSSERSLAQAFAYEIADQMRANTAAAGQDLFSIAAGTTAPAPLVNCGADACSPTEMAAWELSQWQTRLINSLPEGTARIQCSAAAGCAPGLMHTVSVIWNENRLSGLDNACPAPAAFNPAVNRACVQVSFTP